MLGDFDNERCECGPVCAREARNPYGGRCRRLPAVVTIRLTEEQARVLEDESAVASTLDSEPNNDAEVWLEIHQKVRNAMADNGLKDF